MVLGGSGLNIKTSFETITKSWFFSRENKYGKTFKILEPFLRKTRYTLRSLRFRDSEVILENTNFEEERQETEQCFWGRISGTYFETIKDLVTWQLHTTKEQI